MWPLCLFALVVVSSSTSPDAVLDELGSEGTAILAGAKIEGVFVRQCSCTEQTQCQEEMKIQADECTHPCFSHFNAVTDRPQELRECFDSKIAIVDAFINCFASRVDSCVPHSNGPMIQKTNIADIFHLGEKKLNQKPSATVQALLAPIKHYLDAAGEFANCVKNCFLKKNSNGFCFDRKGCQPQITDSKALTSLKTCTRRLQWKRQAGEICDCSVNAGLTDLKQYCSMFKLMARRHH